MDEKINSGLADWVHPAPADLPALPAKVVAVATGEPLPSNFEQTPQNLARLARELAINIRDPKTVIKEFGLTPEQYENQIKPNPLFASALQALIAEWNDAGNTPKRLRLQAQAILEDTMPAVGARISEQREELKDVVSALNAISKIAGMEGEKTPVAVGEKFTITINLGSDTLKYDKITGTPTGTLELTQEKSNEVT